MTYSIDGKLVISQFYADMKRISQAQAELRDLEKDLTAIRAEMALLGRKRPSLCSPIARWNDQARFHALATEHRALLARERQLRAQSSPNIPAKVNNRPGG